MRAHLHRARPARRALALARQIDRVLAAQPAPEPPPAFTAALMARLRRERWRSEQSLDVAFNVAVGLAVAVGVGGVVMVVTASGLAAVSADLVRVFLSADRFRVRDDRAGAAGVRAAPARWWSAGCSCGGGPNTGSSCEPATPAEWCLTPCPSGRERRGRQGCQHRPVLAAKRPADTSVD